MADQPQKPRLVAPKREFAQKETKKPVTAARSRPTAKPARRKTPKAPKKRGIIARFLRFVFWIFWWLSTRLAIIFALIVGASTFYYYAQLPEARVLMDDRQKGSVTMLDRNGAVFAWRGDQFGGLVDPQTVSPHLRNAVIATEDKRFYRHLGISPRGIAGAIRTNLREGRGALEGHGGSTITQQVAKRVFFDDLRAIERKIKEVPMSLAMEIKYTKDEILAIYLNRAYLGAGAYGFEAASQRYFGKNATETTPAEAAMLAGLLKAPSRNAPTNNMARAISRANLIIGLMEDQNLLSAAQAQEARDNPAKLSRAARQNAGGFFADYIMEAAPDFIIKDTKEDIVIKTTFDRSIQRKAERALAAVFEEKVKEGSKAQAAIVVLSRDGAVRAMVGGRNLEFAGAFNRATQALRQTGSSFKPFVYAAALQAGFQYNSVVVDAPHCYDIPGSGQWCPRNYTRKHYGEMTLTQALADSINTVAVEVSESIGREHVRALAQDFGLNPNLAVGPALALGASEATLLEMTGAYAGILNGGVQAIPYGLTELTIQGDDAPLLGKAGGSGQRVISKRAARQLTYMMNQVIETGSGKRAKLADREAAGKTGTTQGARDAWFIGFTEQYVTGVWMGYDDNSKLSGVTGGGLPAEIWREVMSRIHKDEPALALKMTRNIKAGNQTLAQGTGPRNQRSGGDGQKIRQELNAIESQIKEDLKELENEAKTILQKIFGRRN